MIFHNAVKRILTAPSGSDPRSADRIALLCRVLNIPKKGIPLVKIMGESGKSACAAMLSQALTHYGYQVGCLTTPFSHTMTECITLNGVAVSMDTFTSCVSRVCSAITQIKERLATFSEPFGEEEDTLTAEEKAIRAYRAYSDDFSPFADELLLTAALLCFTEANCQILLVEVPTGERAGAYRLPIPSTVSIITSTESSDVATSICRMLDKRTQETVTALQSKAVYSIISNACAKINCRLSMPLRGTFYPMNFTIDRAQFYYNGIALSLGSGAYYQLLNRLTVIETLTALKRNGFNVDPNTPHVSNRSGGVGMELQFNFLSLQPTVITDFADTPTRMKAFADSLAYQTERLGSKVTVFTEPSEHPDLSDGAIMECFLSRNIPAEQIFRATIDKVRPVLKGLIRTLSPKNTVFILGSRAFVYETTRVLRDLMA